MSQEVRQIELQKKTQQLMDGPLKHIKAAALAAALLPLASVAVAPASAQAFCPSGGICGTVFNDANNNGTRDAGEVLTPGAAVYVYDGTDTITVYTDNDGFYYYGGSQFDGTYVVTVPVPQGMQASPSNVGNDATDSDGVPILQNSQWFSVASVTRLGGLAFATDFGFADSQQLNPGTGTPGYWKNHPEAWPVSQIVVGGRTYTMDEAIAWLGKVGKDKTTTIFASYVSAWLNVKIRNDSSCVSAAMGLADAWLAAHPVGSNVAGSSDAWQTAEPWHQTMDAYNNGRLCAPHRQ